MSPPDLSDQKIHEVLLSTVEWAGLSCHKPVMCLSEPFGRHDPDEQGDSVSASPGSCHRHATDGWPPHPAVARAVKQGRWREWVGG